MRKFEYDYIPRAKKVKHIKYFCVPCFGVDIQNDLQKLEDMINSFADDHPDFKILGIRTHIDTHNIVATVTYLEDVEGQFTTEDYDDSDD